MMIFPKIHKDEEALIDPEAAKGPTVAWTSQIPCFKRRNPFSPFIESACNYYQIKDIIKKLVDNKESKGIREIHKIIFLPP